MDSRDSLKTWKVLATDDVEEDLSEFVQYLLFEKMSKQAADAVLEDYDETLDESGHLREDLHLLSQRRDHDGSGTGIQTALQYPLGTLPRRTHQDQSCAQADR